MALKLFSATRATKAMAEPGKSGGREHFITGQCPVTRLSAAVDAALAAGTFGTLTLVMFELTRSGLTSLRFSAHSKDGPHNR